jgi:hypothetical protein
MLGLRDMSVGTLRVLNDLGIAYLAFRSVETFGIMLCKSIDISLGSVKKELRRS